MSMEKILEVIIHQFSRPMNTKVSSLVCSKTVKSFDKKFSRPKKLDFLKISLSMKWRSILRTPIEVDPDSYPAVRTEAVGWDL